MEVASFYFFISLQLFFGGVVSSAKIIKSAKPSLLFPNKKKTITERHRRVLEIEYKITCSSICGPYMRAFLPLLL